MRSVENTNPLDSAYTKPPNPTRVVEDSALKKAPENYISARDLHAELGICANTARAWRYFEKIRAKKIGNTWFYPRQDLLKLTEKRNRRIYPITICGKPTKRKDVKHVVVDTVLKEALGDYISAREAQNPPGIKEGTLQKWRDSGRLRAKKIRNTWYYSRQDLLKLLKTEPQSPPESR